MTGTASSVQRPRRPDTWQLHRTHGPHHPSRLNRRSSQSCRHHGPYGNYPESDRRTKRSTRPQVLGRHTRRKPCPAEDEVIRGVSPRRRRMEGSPSACRHHDRVTVPDHIRYSAGADARVTTGGPRDGPRRRGGKAIASDVTLPARGGAVTVSLRKPSSGHSCYLGLAVAAARGPKKGGQLLKEKLSVLVRVDLDCARAQIAARGNVRCRAPIWRSSWRKATPPPLTHSSGCGATTPQLSRPNHCLNPGARYRLVNDDLPAIT